MSTTFPFPRHDYSHWEENKGGGGRALHTESMGEHMPDRMIGRRGWGGGKRVSSQAGRHGTAEEWFSRKKTRLGAPRIGPLGGSGGRAPCGACGARQPPHTLPLAFLSLMPLQHMHSSPTSRQTLFFLFSSGFCRNPRIRGDVHCLVKANNFLCACGLREGNILTNSDKHETEWEGWRGGGGG